MSSETTVPVNVEELRATKDAVLLRLMGIQKYISQLSEAYLEHTNKLIAGESASIELPAAPAHLAGQVEFLHPHSPGANPEEGKKKRKRAPADPNAPKRALTPYFLYMQHNRPKISADLGKDARPKDVADEGTRRWQNMPDDEKEIYKQMYAENYEVYKKEMAAYKAGKAVDSDLAANQLQQDFAGAENSRDTDDSSDSESEEESSPSPPQPPKVKTPPKSTKRRKSETKAQKEVAESPAPKQASPVKKRGKAAAAEPVSAKATPAENKRKTKKRKSEV